MSHLDISRCVWKPGVKDYLDRVQETMERGVKKDGLRVLEKICCRGEQRMEEVVREREVKERLFANNGSCCNSL